MKQLSLAEFQVLAAMGAREMAGRDIRIAFEKEFGRISYGTLYTTLRRLRESGFLEDRDDADADGRIRYFKLTGKGQTALTATRTLYRTLAAAGLSSTLAVP